MNKQMKMTNPDIKIITTYHDGEYLSGYQVYGAEAKLLEQISLSRYVDGWGYLVSDETVKALGTTISYNAALKYALPAIWEQAEKERCTRITRELNFAYAKRENRQVILSEYTDECNDPREECDVDNITVYAMPDGTTKTTRSHTY